MKEVEIREKKKSNTTVTFLLCIAFLLLGAGISYAYLNNTNNKAPIEDENEDVKQLSEDNILVKELISRIDINNNCGVEPGLYTKSKFTVNDFDKNYAMKLIAKEANGKNINNYVKFTKEDYDNAVKILFGNGVNFENTNISGCPNIYYDNANQIYLSDNTNNCDIECNGIKYVRHIVKAEKTNTNIYIYVAVAAFDEIGKKVMNINDTNSVIQKIDGNIFEISKDYEKVNNYKYTFNYDKTIDNYIFKSIELQK